MNVEADGYPGRPCSWIPAFAGMTERTIHRASPPSSMRKAGASVSLNRFAPCLVTASSSRLRSEEHTSELQSLMRISYAVFCLKKKKKDTISTNYKIITNNTTANNKLKK